MSFKPVVPRIGLQPIDATSTTAQHTLGTIVRAVETNPGSTIATSSYGESQFIYLKGVANTVVGSVVTYYESDYTTALLAADAVGQVAVAMSANVASQYGWYMIKGKAAAKCVASVADNGLVHTCTTAGSIDDAATAGERVHCAQTAGATDSAGTGLCYLEINFPYVQNGATD
jgi:hypothetical protein